VCLLALLSDLLLCQGRLGPASLVLLVLVLLVLVLLVLVLLVLVLLVLVLLVLVLLVLVREAHCSCRTVRLSTALSRSAEAPSVLCPSVRRPAP
jgi:Flp pilus assembly protein TadB